MSPVTFNAPVALAMSTIPPEVIISPAALPILPIVGVFKVPSAFITDPPVAVFIASSNAGMPVVPAITVSPLCPILIGVFTPESLH